MFNSGYLKILVCTTTITEGVNTNAKNIVVLHAKKGDKALKPFDAKNIKGRAGRFQHHFKGRLISLERDFNIILENIEYIMGTMFSKVFDVYDEEEEKYYISEIIIELSKGLSKNKGYDINKIYDHELKAIFEKFFDLLEDLNNTNVPKNEDYNKTLMDRIKAFLDIIFSKEIYELDDYKYNVVLDMASIVEDINELSKLKKKIVFYNRLTDEDFEVTLDDSVDILTDTSIKLLKEGKSKTLKFQENNNNK